MLPALSIEQKNIIDFIQEKKDNIIVDAVAGSGKTTLILHLAKVVSEQKIIILTYNARLKDETRQKINNLNLTNIECHSYHALGCKYYQNCATDMDMAKIVSQNIPIYKQPNINILVLDECQDMTPIYFHFICKFLKDINPVRLIIIGDRYQSIFTFNRADKRYIIYADKIWFDTPHLINSWSRFPLSTSYRLTNQMVDFVNMTLKQNRISPCNKSGPEVDYVICNTFDKYKLSNYIMDFIDQYGYENIFILAPSLRSTKSPVALLANYLSSKKNIPILVAVNEDRSVSPEESKGKLTFATFHQVKGLERKCVIIFGFDQSYFEYYAKSLNQHICPNTLYVAVTRATEKLIVIHGDNQSFFNFVEEKKLNNIIRLSSKKNTIEIKESKKQKIYGVTELIRHLPSTCLYEAFNFIGYDNKKKDIELKIPNYIYENKLQEDVSDINGVAIQILYEILKTDKTMILDVMRKEELNNNNHKYKKKIHKFENFKLDDISKILELANYYIAFRSGYIHRTNQIKTYKWLSEHHAEQCIIRLSNTISANIFEYEVRRTILGIDFVGFIDMIDTENKILWELKMVKKIKPEHFIQLAAYVYLSDDQFKDYKYCLYNVLDDSLYEVTFNNLDDMMKLLVRSKYFEDLDDTDDVFINYNIQTKNNVFNNEIDKIKIYNIKPRSEQDVVMVEKQEDYKPDNLMF
jgi:hypothetical protein